MHSSEARPTGGLCKQLVIGVLILLVSLAFYPLSIVAFSILYGLAGLIIYSEEMEPAKSAEYMDIESLTIILFLSSMLVLAVAYTVVPPNFVGIFQHTIANFAFLSGCTGEQLRYFIRGDSTTQNAAYYIAGSFGIPLLVMASLVANPKMMVRTVMANRFVYDRILYPWTFILIFLVIGGLLALIVHGLQMVCRTDSLEGYLLHFNLFKMIDRKALFGLPLLSLGCLFVFYCVHLVTQLSYWTITSSEQRFLKDRR